MDQTTMIRLPEVLEDRLDLEGMGGASLGASGVGNPGTGFGGGGGGAHGTGNTGGAGAAGCIVVVGKTSLYMAIYAKISSGTVVNTQMDLSTDFLILHILGWTLHLVLVLMVLLCR